MKMLKYLFGDAANPCGRHRLTVDDEAESAGGAVPPAGESPPAPTTPDPIQDEGTPSPSDTAPPQPDWQKNWSELKTRYDTEVSSLRSNMQRMAEELDRMRQPETAVVDELDERAGRLADELAKIPNDDPARIKKVYRNLLEVQDDLARRRAYQVVQQAETAERRHLSAEVETVQALKAAGLDDTYLQEAYKELYYLDHVEPNWDRGLAQEQAISTLVERVKAGIERVRGQSQVVADANAQQRKSAAGVLGEGARGVRTTKETPEDEPDSMLDQLKQLRRDNLAEGQKRWSQLVARPK